jgi:hypothetical protein
MFGSYRFGWNRGRNSVVALEDVFSTDGFDLADVKFEKGGIRMTHDGHYYISVMATTPAE